MLVARLFCSGPGCAAAFEARAPTLGELETLACDCGCALEICGWPDSGAAVTELELMLAG